MLYFIFLSFDFLELTLLLNDSILPFRKFNFQCLKLTNFFFQLDICQVSFELIKGKPLTNKRNFSHNPQHKRKYHVPSYVTIEYYATSFYNR